MKSARWYPSVIFLPDGRVVVIGGLVSPGVAADPPEVYDPVANTWTLLGNARLIPQGGSYPQEFQYPQTYLLPDGKIFMTGGPRFGWTLDVDAQKWSITGASATETSSSTMYS